MAVNVSLVTVKQKGFTYYDCLKTIIIYTTIIQSYRQ